MPNSEWQVTIAEQGRYVYSWKQYEVKQIRQVVSASYIGSSPPVHADVWKATYTGELLDTPFGFDHLRLMDYCEEHDNW